MAIPGLDQAKRLQASQGSPPPPCSHPQDRVPLTPPRPPTTLVCAGNGRRGAPPHLQTPDPQLPTEVPQLRNEVGGEYEESQKSTRSTSLLIRRNEQSIKFLIDPHCIDAPSTEDMQRALPNLKEFQRLVFPVAPKPVENANWRAIPLLPGGDLVKLRTSRGVGEVCGRKDRHIPTLYGGYDSSVGLSCKVYQREEVGHRGVPVAVSAGAGESSEGLHAGGKPQARTAEHRAK